MEGELEPKGHFARGQRGARPLGEPVHYKYSSALRGARPGLDAPKCHRCSAGKEAEQGPGFVSTVYAGAPQGPQGSDCDQLVINDEAHHVHDEELKWSQSLLSIHQALPKG